MEKLLMVLTILLFINGCMTVVFEPYWEDGKKEKSSNTHQVKPTSASDKHLSLEQN